MLPLVYKRKASLRIPVKRRQHEVHHHRVHRRRGAQQAANRDSLLHPSPGDPEITIQIEHHNRLYYFENCSPVPIPRLLLGMTAAQDPLTPASPASRTLFCLSRTAPALPLADRRSYSGPCAAPTLSTDRSTSESSLHRVSGSR